MHVYDVDIATAKLTMTRITCMLLRNKTKWRLTLSYQQVVIVKALD